MTTTLHSPEEVLLAFAGALRHAGLPVTHDRATTFVDAVARLGLVDPAAVWGAGRATLCAGPDDLDRFDNVFAAWWSADEPPATAPEGASRTSTMALDPRDGRGAGEEGAEAVRAAASTEEVLRHRDVAGLSAADKALLDDLIARLEPRLPRRRARRRTPSARGEVDARRTLRATLRQHGEPAQVLRRRPATRPRRVVMLVDVSGSMAPYAEALLRAAHRWVRAGEGQVEVFTLGTRFTRVTPALTHRDPGVALDAAGRAVPDWSGGTRLGETLRAFCNRWGQRGLARGAVVVVFSDGWERGHYVMLGEQVARLRRLARRVVWANPHRGRPGYEQVQQGVVAVLPHVDDFVAGHSLASWAQVGEVVARA